MAKVILKRGKLGEGEKAIITLNHKEISVDDLAKKLKRSPEQIKKFIEDHLSSGAKQENVEAIENHVYVERTGVATVMTEAEASKPPVKSGPIADPPHIFRQPVKNAAN